MDPIQTIDYINAFQDAVNTLVLCSGYSPSQGNRTRKRMKLKRSWILF